MVKCLNHWIVQILFFNKIRNSYAVLSKEKGLLPFAMKLFIKLILHQEIQYAIEQDAHEQSNTLLLSMNNIKMSS